MAKMNWGKAVIRDRMIRRERIHYYATCWNEEYMLPHFLAHYGEIADRIVIVDDGSTDNSLALLDSVPKVEVRPTNRLATEPYIPFNKNLYDNIWKESRGQADWVIVGNIDELLYAHHLRNYLLACTRNGVTVVPVIGFEMVSREPVQQAQHLLSTVRTGAFSEWMSKLAIFNPLAIEEINYSDGRHKCNPVGDVVLPDDDCVLNLHFKQVGLERTFKRLQDQDKRRSEFERANDLGFQYGFDWDQFLEEWWEPVERNSIDVLEWYGGERRLPVMPWWRQRPSWPTRSV
jgi:glycosyltransferase involved in cell wall biosynthesis